MAHVFCWEDALGPEVASSELEAEPKYTRTRTACTALLRRGTAKAAAFPTACESASNLFYTIRR